MTIGEGRLCGHSRRSGRGGEAVEGLEGGEGQQHRQHLLEQLPQGLPEGSLLAESSPGQQQLTQQLLYRLPAGGAGQAQTGQDGAKPCKAGQKQVGHARQSQNTANIPNAWEKIGGDSSQSSRAATFMGFRELKEEEERHCILEEGIPQQLEAFIAVTNVTGTHPAAAAAAAAEEEQGAWKERGRPVGGLHKLGLQLAGQQALIDIVQDLVVTTTEFVRRWGSSCPSLKPVILLLGMMPLLLGTDLSPAEVDASLASRQELPGPGTAPSPTDDADSLLNLLGTGRTAEASVTAAEGPAGAGWSPSKSIASPVLHAGPCSGICTSSRVDKGFQPYLTCRTASQSTSGNESSMVWLGSSQSIHCWSGKTK
ncbi:MAG: hypothetical protein FRX49_09216 [Trebouxia sp. A1-2]|nr:MAG: hypothetical protein FRX49_09216 [Trebouxia sp. A1-2]